MARDEDIAPSIYGSNLFTWRAGAAGSGGWFWRQTGLLLPQKKVPCGLFRLSQVALSLLGDMSLSSLYEAEQNSLL